MEQFIGRMTFCIIYLLLAQPNFSGLILENIMKQGVRFPKLLHESVKSNCGSANCRGGPDGFLRLGSEEKGRGRGF